MCDKVVCESDACVTKLCVCDKVAGEKVVPRPGDQCGPKRATTHQHSVVSAMLATQNEGVCERLMCEKGCVCV